MRSPALTFIRLPGERRRDLLQALAVVAFIRLGLTVLGFVRLHRLLRPMLTVGALSHPGAPERIRWAVGTAARRVPAATCLTQALSAQVLLARAGYPSALRMGTRLTEGRLEAHAWLEEEGRVVFGARGEFQPMPPIEPLLR